MTTRFFLVWCLTFGVWRCETSIAKWPIKYRQELRIKERQTPDAKLQTTSVLEKANASPNPFFILIVANANHFSFA